jgi:exodeoxyribonuclease VII large subunit
MNNAETKVKLLDPVTVMSRGWSITRDKNGNVLRTVSDITVGDTLTTYLADGSVVSTANEVQK